MPNRYDFIALQQYTIGYGALRDIRRLTRGMGQRYLVMHDQHCVGVINERIRESLSGLEPVLKPPDNAVGRAPGLLDSLSHADESESPCEIEFRQVVNGACTIDAARIEGDEIRRLNPDVVIAAGGAKCLDLVRAALHYVGAYRRPKLIVCPTVASSNASANGMSVIYDGDTGQMADFWSLAYMPEGAIVDTEVLIQAPTETLVAGIGDQVASSLEAIHTLKHLGEAAICDPLCIAHHQSVLDVLRTCSVDAVRAAQEKTVTKEYEWVCHAVTRYTGPQLAVATAFYSHILDEALIDIPALKGVMHGMLVGYGVLPEMVAFGTPDEMYPWIDLFAEIGIPVTLDQLGIGDISYDDLLGYCENATNKIMASRAVVRWTAKEMANAVFEADLLASEYLKDKR